VSTQAEYGGVVCEETQTGFNVTQADPRIHITKRVIELSYRERLRRDGDIIRIVADNGTWIYRITGYDERLETYAAEWVD